MGAPVATSTNWKEISLKIHAYFMKDMGISIPSLEERVFLGLALAGEAGELANKIKKLWRDGPNPELLTDVLMEMADINGYLLHLAASFNVDMDKITAIKTQELIERWPHIFEDIRDDEG